MNAISARGLTKTYRSPRKAQGLLASLRSLWHREHTVITAVSELDLELAPGETVGFLGPNGAGKTTTLKMLAGLIEPTAGTVRVLGYDSTQRPPELLRRLTLVMGNKQQLLWDLPPSETFELNRALYDVDRARFARIRDELVDLLALGSVIDRPARNLPLGERMKCELAAGLIHEPEVLFLDEPTIGLDVSMQVAVRQFIADWSRRHGATVLLTSHYMDDIAALCSRVVVIDGGRLRYDGALTALAERYAPERAVRIRLARPPVEPVGPLAVVGQELVGQVPAAAVPELLARVMATGEVLEVSVEPQPLEDALRRLFGGAA